MKRQFLSGLAVLLLAAAGFAQDVPKNTDGRHVTDLAGVLSDGERGALERKLEAYQRQTSNEVAILILKQLPEGEDINSYALRVADQWKVGKTGKDNGILLTIDLGRGEMRIDTGRGIEGALTDVRSGVIIREVIGPRFKDGKYAEGLNAGIDAIAAAVGGEFTADEKPPEEASYGWLWWVLIGYGVVLLIALCMGGPQGMLIVLELTFRILLIFASRGGGSGGGSKGFGGGSFGGGGARGRF